MAEMTVNGYAMSYVEAGSGEPLVLVHGSLLDQRYWRPQMDVFGQKFRTSPSACAITGLRPGTERATTSPSPSTSPTSFNLSGVSGLGKCG